MLKIRRQSCFLCLLVACAAVYVLPVAAAEEGDSIESTYLTNIKQLTSPDDFEKAGEAYFSPDQKTIVYQAVADGYPFYQIYTQPLAGGKAKRISTGRGRTTCSYFTTDGKRLIFASSHLDADLEATEAAARKQIEEDKKSGNRRRYSWPFDKAMDIFETDLDGHFLRRLTKEEGYDAEGAFSPDGKLIAFCSDRDGDPDLYVMNSDGTGVRQLTNSPGYDGGPFISPDGKWVIFRSDRKQEHFLQIYAIGIDGKNEVALTDSTGVNWGPYWHPTEPYIIWSGADHSDPKARPNYDLWLMKYTIEEGQLKPGKVTRVTDHPSADVLPVFSPDGKQLMWTSSRTPNHTSQVYIADFHLPKE